MNVSVCEPDWLAPVIATPNPTLQVAPATATPAVSAPGLRPQSENAPPLTLADTLLAGILWLAPSVIAAVGLEKNRLVSRCVRVSSTFQVVTTVSAPVAGVGEPANVSDGGAPVTVMLSPMTYDRFTEAVGLTMACACAGANTSTRAT